jgi:hypothetical protein
MKRRLIRLILVASLALSGSALLPVAPAQAFVGHGCSITTCRYFTSSYSTARYFYDRTNCGQWKSLSRTYLHGFRTKTALHNSFPARKLHPPC